MRIHINTTTGFALFLESSSSSPTILSSSTICPFSVAVCLQIQLSRSSIDISSTKHRNYNGTKPSNLSIKRGGIRAFCKSMDWETAGGPSRNSSHNISKTDNCAIQKKNKLTQTREKPRNENLAITRCNWEEKGKECHPWNHPVFVCFQVDDNNIPKRKEINILKWSGRLIDQCEREWSLPSCLLSTDKIHDPDI